MPEGMNGEGAGGVGTQPRAQGEADRRDTRQRCDLVMKGGITSGVVYPAAVSDLHERYRFANIGGASAGAIAAAATAAAELGDRELTEGQSTSAGGFPALAAISGELTDEGLLQGLFAPTKTVKPAFELLLALQRSRSTFGKVATGVGRLVQRLWVYVGGAMLVALLLLAALVNQFHPSGDPALLGWVVLAVLLLLFGALGLVGGVVHRAHTIVTKHLPNNFFGLCTGMPTDAEDTSPKAALTPWLHQKLQHLSGKGDGSPGDKTPLTFGALCAANITLTMMTTDVSSARPVQMPAGFPSYLFSRDDFLRLFPEPVVEAMVNSSEQIEVDGRVLHRLLEHDDLPVIVATRMSLSFPVLLSAVPLYTVRETSKGRQLRKHWISDGGISSNFPIHLFDSWLPRHPTLALSFLPTEMAAELGDPDGCRDRSGPPPHVPSESLFGFLGQILTTMQNWRDTLQSELPGFSDRVQVVPLEDHEGGMNLTMSKETINSLIGKGHDAATKLLKRFKWEHHRLHRFQMTMGLLEQELGPDGSLQSDSADELLRELLAKEWPPECDCRPDEPREWPATAAAQTMALRGLVNTWAEQAEPDPKAPQGCGPTRPTPDPPPWTPPDVTVSFSGGTRRRPPSVIRRTPQV